MLQRLPAQTLHALAAAPSRPLSPASFSRSFRTSLCARMPSSDLVKYCFSLPSCTPSFSVVSAFTIWSLADHRSLDLVGVDFLQAFRCGTWSILVVASRRQRMPSARVASARTTKRCFFEHPSTHEDLIRPLLGSRAAALSPACRGTGSQPALAPPQRPRLVRPRKPVCLHAQMRAALNRRQREGDHAAQAKRRVFMIEIPAIAQHLPRDYLHHLALQHPAPVTPQLKPVAHLRHKIIAHQPFLNQRRLRQGTPQLVPRMGKRTLHHHRHRPRPGSRSSLHPFQQCFQGVHPARPERRHPRGPIHQRRQRIRPRAIPRLPPHRPVTHQPIALQHSQMLRNRRLRHARRRGQRADRLLAPRGTASSKIAPPRRVAQRSEQHIRFTPHGTRTSPNRTRNP